MKSGGVMNGSSFPTDRISGDRENDVADECWRVQLLRALVCGNINLLEYVLDDHIEVLSLPFTKAIPEWKVQWDSLHWWMLSDATPLFIAAAYSHPELVQWLLARGADRDSKCYLRRTPIDVVGECVETAMTMTATSPKDSVLERSAACRKFLITPASVPAPPTANVLFCSHVSTQVVILKAPSSSSSSSKALNKTNASRPPSGTQHTVFRCLMEVTWDAPLSNGALIDKYEVRYRLLVEETEGDDGTTASWRVERVAHNRKIKIQRLLVENLQFGSSYDFMLRSWNMVGKGDWGRVYKIRTVASPERTTDT